jgi:hypothetical protein
MTNFNCMHCGAGSLVRSNFRFNQAGDATCRDIERCLKRRKPHADDGATDRAQAEGSRAES